MEKKRILVVSQCFYPEQFRINDICSYWVENGYEVTVVTGIPNYPHGKFFKGYGIFKKRKEIYNGINIIHLPIIARGQSQIMLILNYISFVVSGFFWKAFTRQKADEVFVYASSPMTQALVGIWFAKKVKAPCFVYVLDLWPETVEYITGIKCRPIIHPLQKIVDSIYYRSDKICTAAESCIPAIQARGIPIEKLAFWPQYAEDIYKPLSKENLSVPEIPNDGRFNIIFAGNIGIAQGLLILPDTAAELKKHGKLVRFCIVGDGRCKEKLICQIKEKQVSDYFCLVDWQPVERTPEFMAVCDAALVCLAPSKVFSMTIPAKIQSCMACGIPIIGSADGEVPNIIRRAKAGVCADAGDANMLADKIEEIISLSKDQLAQMGENAHKFFIENFERERLLHQMDNWLMQEY